MCGQSDDPSGYAPQGYYDPIETAAGIVDFDDPRKGSQMTKTWDEMRGDIFDSRDVIERIAELRDMIDAADGDDSEHPDSTFDVERAELAILAKLEDEASDGSIPDWRYGETFIPESRFEDYARELAEDIGSIQADAPWPASYIDWERAADALKMDYTSFEIDGETYWAR